VIDVLPKMLGVLQGGVAFKVGVLVCAKANVVRLISKPQRSKRIHRFNTTVNFPWISI
jgi:hypothetical protein